MAVEGRSGVRGNDTKKRAQRSCDRCRQFCILRVHTCTGRGGAPKCDLFDSDGKRSVAAVLGQMRRMKSRDCLHMIEQQQRPVQTNGMMICVSITL